MGATQNSHSCEMAISGPNRAGPVLRAGLTEVLVTGIEIRWISVRHRPMASPPKPAAARLAVAPRMTRMKKAVITTSVTRRSEEHTSELQSLAYLVCRLL